MNPTGFDQILFRGIPRSPNRGPGTFFTSLAIHVAGLLVLLLAAPQIINKAALHIHTTLIAPLQPEPVAKPEPPRVVAKAQPQPQPLRPLPRPAQPHIALPKLDEAPALPNITRPAPVLPAQNPVIQPPVQTGLFAAGRAPQAEPKLSVPPARQAGFETASISSTAAPQTAVATADFDAHAPQRPVATAAVVRSGGFADGSTDPRSNRAVTGKVTRTGFDSSAASDKPAALNQSVRKTAFDEKAASTPAQTAAPAVAAMRPVEILEKPKPVYTAEARALKIEGTVLLDVLFGASGEIRVLGVVNGLGHGLDENAVDAARRIRFNPAKQSGKPVDERVLLHVVFQITG